MSSKAIASLSLLVGNESFVNQLLFSVINFWYSSLNPPNPLTLTLVLTPTSNPREIEESYIHLCKGSPPSMDFCLRRSASAFFISEIALTRSHNKVVSRCRPPCKCV
jgi:hypothetical protein